MKSWVSNGNLRVCLGGDIGGSGFSFCFSNFYCPDKIIQIPKIRANSAQQFYSALNSLDLFLSKISPNYQCQGTTFATAGLRKYDSICLYNWPEPNSSRTIKIQQLNRRLFPQNRSIILNDLEGGAHGLIFEEINLPQYFSQIFGPKGNILSNNRSAILAGGSGLGAAIICEKNLVVSTEFGYFQIPSFSKKESQSKLNFSQLKQKVSEDFYSGRYSPTFEDFSSGKSLGNIYRFLNEDSNISCSEEVAVLAKNGDERALNALKINYHFLMKCAKNLAIGMKCDSIILALSNQVKNSWFVKKHSDLMEIEFCDHPESKKLQEVRVYTQTKKMNFNLLGAVRMAHKIANLSLKHHISVVNPISE